MQVLVVRRQLCLRRRVDVAPGRPQMRASAYPVIGVQRTEDAQHVHGRARRMPDTGVGAGSGEQFVIDGYPRTLGQAASFDQCCGSSSWASPACCS